jgi:GntR family transcriptional repressor for pyruvate dehydrogenase complex
MLDILREEKLLLPGSRLPPERELCERFQVSRTVVRETVNLLVAQGLLKQVGGKGTFVSQNAAEPLINALNVFVRRNALQGYRELVEVRSVLEVEIAGLAAERASAAL